MKSSEKLVFERMEANQYRAVLSGRMLRLAKKNSLLIQKGDDGKFVNLHASAWMSANAAHGSGLLGSAGDQRFDADATYFVYYIPQASPPYLFAIKAP